MALENAAPIGRRLAAIRQRRRLTAAQLAELVPAEKMTRMVIVNIEGGRKQDLSATEVMQLAAALGVSPLALLIDTGDPWAALDVPGLPERVASMTGIEYARSATLYGPRGGMNGGFRVEVSAFLDALVECEVQIAQGEFIRSMMNDPEDVDPEDGYSGETPHGEPWSVSGSEIDEEGLQASVDTLVAAYRGALAARERDARWSRRGSKLLRLPPAIDARLEQVREAVVSAIAEYPDVDYGQDDRYSRWGRSSSPKLDPATGRPDHDDDYEQWKEAGRPPLSTDG